MIETETRRWRYDARIALGGGGIPSTDAIRQERTAQAILDRFAVRPGIVLADEVGMGKTFVALAVAASAAFASEEPVVVMVPPRLMEKWERDVHRFRAACLRAGVGTDFAPELRLRRAERGVEFLACFDDAPERRAHIVLLANTALHRAERDPFVRLEAMRQALSRHAGGARALASLARFARDLLRSSSLQGWTEDDFGALMAAPVDQWMEVARGCGHPLDDDPVPAAFIDALGGADLSELAEALELVPRRSSKNVDERIEAARSALNVALRSLWSQALQSATIRSPLLIVDEAHHLKNPDTRLASLFLDPDAEDTSVISGAFDRMLFLTATPFQLGHHELLEVLRRFLAVRGGSLSDELHFDLLKRDLEELGQALDRAQQEAVQLDRLWGALRPPMPGQVDVNQPGAWASLLESGAERAGCPELIPVIEQYERARSSMRNAEVLLKPWVIRHLRDRQLHSVRGVVPRRIQINGKGIDDGQDNTSGLPIPPHARFPFLLCARAQSMLSRRAKARAYFAEGLASSFEAFHETSEGGRPKDDSDADLEQVGATDEIEWYLGNVRENVSVNPPPHPKIEATVRRALIDWKAGNKVLVFGHFRYTIRTLARRLREAVDDCVADMAVQGFGLTPADRGGAVARVQRIVQRLQDRESPLRREVRMVLERWTSAAPSLTANQREQVVELLLGTLATPSFVVRNLPLDREELRSSLEAERPTTAQARIAAEAVAESLARRRGSRIAYRARVESFLGFLQSTLASDEERDEVLRELSAADKDVVRHASGEVKPETRRRLLLGFNSPLLPEILVASEVMAEGLDLHLDCRHVIHHDLSWNPSTLEQRTGRIDRLRCLAEQEGESIRIYLPYLEGTADEKMFRVVTDRARWFQVVMGEKYEVDEQATQRLSERVPFPEEAALGLAFDLSVVGSDS